MNQLLRYLFEHRCITLVAVFVLWIFIHHLFIATHDFDIVAEQDRIIRCEGAYSPPYAESVIVTCELSK